MNMKNILKIFFIATCLITTVNSGLCSNSTFELNDCKTVISSTCKTRNEFVSTRKNEKATFISNNFREQKLSPANSKKDNFKNTLPRILSIKLFSKIFYHSGKIVLKLTNPFYSLYQYSENEICIRAP